MASLPLDSILLKQRAQLRALRVLAALYLCLSGCVSRAHLAITTTERPVHTRASIRHVVDLYVCAAWLEDVQAYEARFGDSRCLARALVQPDKILLQAIEAALADTNSLVPLAAPAYQVAYGKLLSPNSLSQGQLDTAVRDAFWADAHLGPAVLARTAHHLRLGGEQCGDCPQLDLREKETLSWAAFQRYISAYIWPVQEPNEETVQVYVCGAHNGVTALQLVDDRMLDAGFFGAVTLAENAAAHTKIAGIVLGQHSLAETQDLIADFLASEATLRTICQALDDKRWFFNIEVSECAPPRR